MRRGRMRFQRVAVAPPFSNMEYIRVKHITRKVIGFATVFGACRGDLCGKINNNPVNLAGG